MRFTIFTAVLMALSFAHGSAIADFAPDSIREFDQYVTPLLPAKFDPSTGGNKTKTARSILDVLLNRRQTCGSGYGYCSGLGICCPSSNRCCSYGYCLPPNNACCPNGPCGSGKTCCGYNHCHPVGTECCGDESYCEAGNICVKFASLSYDVCCTNTKCTAYVTGGTTVSRTTAQPTQTFTQVTYYYYYFTVTWTYYVYYWYYSYAISASVVTSSLETTKSTVSVRATNSAAASSSFAAISATVSHYTPASATSLSSLAGSTKFGSDTDSESATDTGDSGSTGASTSRTASFSTTGGTSLFSGGGASGASRMSVFGDHVLTWFFAGALATFMMMVML